MLRAGGPADGILLDSNSDAESRPRYPRQQPTRGPPPESTNPSAAQSSTWKAQPREQAAVETGSRVRHPPPSKKWMPAEIEATAEWQGGAAPPADGDITYRAQPQAQWNRQGQGSQATGKVSSKEQLRPEIHALEADHSERLAQQAAVIQGVKGLEMSETDRIWHPHLSELLQKQSKQPSNEEAGRAGNALQDADWEEAGMANLESLDVQSDLEMCEDIGSTGVFSMRLKCLPN
jgi:hypothetical protein